MTWRYLYGYRKIGRELDGRQRKRAMLRGGRSVRCASAISRSERRRSREVAKQILRRWQRRPERKTPTAFRQTPASL